MNELSFFENPEEVMSVKDVAAAMGVSYSSVHRAVEKLFPCKMQHGKTTALNKDEVARISRELKKDYHTSQLTLSAGERVANTSTALELQQNFYEAAQAYAKFLEAENSRLQIEIDQQKQRLVEQAPKVEFFDDVTGSSDTIDMKEAAKVLNIKGFGRNNLFEFLRKQNVLDRNNQPYQKYVDAGYFRIIESRYTLPTGEIKISLKTVVFQKGLDFIRRLLERSGRSLLSC